MADLFVALDWVGALLLAAALAMVAFTHREMKAARLLIVLGCLVVTTRWVSWSILSDASWPLRSVIGAIFGALLLGGAPALWSWSKDREKTANQPSDTMIVSASGQPTQSSLSEPRLKASVDMPAVKNKNECSDPIAQLRPELSQLASRFEIGIVPSALGAPDGCVKVISHASKGVYQKSIVIWTAEPTQSFYIIPLDGSNTWWHFNEHFWQREPLSERIAISHSHGPLPKGMHYPFAGIATYIKNNPEQWYRFGWLKWHCQLDNGTTLYRKYANGFAIAAFPITDWAREPSQIYYFFDNKTVEVNQLPGVASGECSFIPDL